MTTRGSDTGRFLRSLLMLPSPLMLPPMLIWPLRLLLTSLALFAYPAQAFDDELISAAEKGETLRVGKLLDSGARVNARDNRGRNAVLAATQGGHLAAARLLIGRGADVNAQDHIRDSAFLLAGARGHTEIARAAIAAGADLKSTNRYGGTALIPACHYGHVETVRLLLAAGVEVNHVNDLGWSALLETVILGDGSARYVEIARLLLAHRADPNLADRQGVTPLAHAQQRNQTEIAELLKTAGARVVR